MRGESLRGEASRFLRALFGRAKGDIYIASVPIEDGIRPGERQIATRLPGRVEAFVERWGKETGRALFFSTATLVPKAQRTRTPKGSLHTKENALEAPSVPCDLDLGDIATQTANPQAEVIKVVSRLTHPPSIIVLSGHGLHCYWLLRQPTEDVKRVEALMCRLHLFLAADTKVKTFHNNLRLPGSHNMKHGEAKPVRILKLDAEAIYSLDELEEMMSKPPVLRRRSIDTWVTQGPVGTVGGPIPGPIPNPFLQYAEAIKTTQAMDVAERFAAMRPHSHKTGRGYIPGTLHDNKRDALASLLARGVLAADAVDEVLEAVKQAVAAAGQTRDWNAERRQLIDMARTWLDKKPDVRAMQDQHIYLNGSDPEPVDTVHNEKIGKPQKPALIRMRATLWPFSLGEDVMRREWFYGTHYARGFVSCTIGASGLGKSSLVMVEALAMASGHNLLGVPVEGPLKVWVLNLEDPMDELKRRIAAVCKHYDIRREDIEGRLYLNSGRDMPLSIAATVGRTIVANAKAIAEMKQTIADNGINVVIIDPFAASHMVEENDNIGMTAVVRTWAEIAEECGCAVELVTHARKLAPNEEVSVEHNRGASAVLAGVRSARVLNRMSEAESDKLGVEDNHKSYFRVDNGKSSMAVSADKASWFKIVSVALGNGDPDNPADEGDFVGVATSWEAPDAFHGLTPDLTTRALAAAREGGGWRRDMRSAAWIGHALAGPLGINSATAEGRRRLTLIVDRWLKSGLLKVVRRLDEQRKLKEFIEAFD